MSLCTNVPFSIIFFFFFNATATTEIYTLSLHDALPILGGLGSSTISGNVISGSYSNAGIWIGANADNNIINSNRVDNQGVGVAINIVAGAVDNYIAGNFLTGDIKIKDLGTGTKYTGKEKITLEAVTNDTGVIWATNPVSYVRLDQDGNWEIKNGKSTGDILILESITNNALINDTDANLELSASQHKLDVGDTLKLIWNGTDWIELSYSDN